MPILPSSKTFLPCSTPVILPMSPPVAFPVICMCAPPHTLRGYGYDAVEKCHLAFEAAKKLKNDLDENNAGKNKLEEKAVKNAAVLYEETNSANLSAINLNKILDDLPPDTPPPPPSGPAGSDGCPGGSDGVTGGSSDGLPGGSSEGLPGGSDGAGGGAKKTKKKKTNK